jgi:hypothetical protein
MADSEKIDEMHGMIHAMKPMLEDVRADQKAMDSRMRVNEARGERHEVKIDRIQSDMDGLGRKVRNCQPASIAEVRGEPRGGKWLAFLEFMAVVPQYWHVCLSIASVGISAVVIAWKTRGH